MKKIIIFVLCLLLAGCSTANNVETARAEKIDWHEYDELINQGRTEQNITLRNEMLHKAEDMLIDSGAVIPLFSNASYYLLKPDTTGVYVDSLNAIHYNKISAPGQSVINISVSIEPPNLDPQNKLLGDVSYVWEGIGASLFKYDENDNLVCDLADHYDVSDDGLVYSFYLKDNLKWSDGKNLTAHDFVYSWKRLAATETGCESATFLSVVKGYPNNLAVEASQDGKVFTVTLEKPCVYFTSIITYSSFTPVRQDVIESAPGYKDANGNIVDPFAWAIDGIPVSCGAYTLDSWKHNESITLKKNPYYYDADSIKTDTINLMLSADGTVAYAAYDSGDISLLFNRIPTDILETLFDNPEFHYLKVLSNAYMYINVADEMFKDMSVEDAKTFRKALGYCIDRVFITQILSLPEECVASTIVPLRTQDGGGNLFGETQGYEYPYEIGYYPARPDLDKARQMLESIGYEFDNDGKLKNAINIEYKTNPAPSNETVATCIQADLAAIGINLTISTLEWSVFLGDRDNGNYEFARGSWSLDYNDPISMLDIMTTANRNNASQIGR